MAGDAPVLNIYHNNNSDLILQVTEGFGIEDMVSDSTKGAKERLDIHLGVEILEQLIEDLTHFAMQHNLTMDNKARRLYDPTGTEHADGIPLGDVTSITSIPAICSIYYSSENIVATGDVIFIDAEKYRNNKISYHIGSNTKNSIHKSTTSYFEIVIKAEFVVRFIKSIEVANILLN